MFLSVYLTINYRQNELNTLIATFILYNILISLEIENTNTWEQHILGIFVTQGTLNTRGGQIVSKTTIVWGDKGKEFPLTTVCNIYSKIPHRSHQDQLQASSIITDED